MKIFYIVGSYSATDQFASPEGSYVSQKKATNSIWENIQSELNDKHPSPMQFEHKTYEQIKDCPLASDGFDNHGIFRVEASSEEEAMLVTLRVHNHFKNRHNQVL